MPQEDNSGTFLRAERFYRGAPVAALPDYVDYDFASELLLLAGLSDGRDTDS